MPEEIDHDAYICGGLTKRISRPSAVSRLVPDPVTTVSECFADVAIWEPWLEAQYGTGEPLP